MSVKSCGSFKVYKMILVSFYLVILVNLSLLWEAHASAGCMELDEYTFDKVVAKFDAVLVKFDVAYPYGEKHDVYVNLAKDAKTVKDLLVAEVGVKDYGDRDNEALAKKYGVRKDDFPSVKLFLKDKEEPITFSDTNGFTVDELRKFVKQHSGIHLSLPGCIQKLDKLVIEFMDANEDGRQALIKKTESVVDGLAEKDKVSGKFYKLVMSKIMDKGDQFVNTEYERINKLKDGKISDDKKKELNQKLNILLTFKTKFLKKDEL